jgi:hypothetical protein
MWSCCRRFQGDVQEALKLLQDPNALKAAIKAIALKHSPDAEAATSISEDVLQGFQRRVYLPPPPSHAHRVKGSESHKTFLCLCLYFQIVQHRLGVMKKEDLQKTSHFRVP